MMSTLFATADSITSARLVSIAPRGYSEDPGIDAKVWECLHVAKLFECASDFDLIHNSYDFLPLSYSRLIGTPVVTTIHGFSSERILPVYQEYAANNHYVSISEADRHPSLEYAATIHHGIDMMAFAPGAGSREYLLFFGRIHPDKGTEEAIRIARRSGLPLVIAGIVQDRTYFERVVEPHVDGDRVRFIGSIGPEGKSELLGAARALVHYVNFDEPFGFSVIEAMACGTPVIATRRGSMPELIVDGVNGHIVGSVEEAIEAVLRIDELEPSAVRESVELRFDRDRMVNDYVALYRRVLAGASRMYAQEP
jgi:glycosyltransferase involved in cell wall biosynthesis